MIREIVSPLDLQVGDLVLVHGAVVRITRENVRFVDTYGKEVVSFSTEYVSGSTRWIDLNRWIRKGHYHVQGNKDAREVRVIMNEEGA